MDPSPASRLIPALLLGCTAAGLSRALRFLTPGGSLAAGLLAFSLFAFGGWQWLLPILFFFLSSSLLSGLRDRLQPSFSDAFEKGSERDASQVLANGGMGLILVGLWQWHPKAGLYAAYLGSLAAATADTWGTELGMLSGHRPVMLTTLKRVGAGASGAVTAAGCAGGAAGALLLAGCGSLWTGGEGIRLILAVTAAGIAGSLADSLLGALGQVQHRCLSCGALTERALHCGTEARYDHGVGWLTNDAVNLCCIIIGAITAFFLSPAQM